MMKFWCTDGLEKYLIRKVEAGVDLQNPKLAS